MSPSLTPMKRRGIHLTREMAWRSTPPGVRVESAPKEVTDAGRPSPDAVAVLRFEIKGYRSEGGSRLPVPRAGCRGIMQPVPGWDTEFGSPRTA